MGWGLSVNCAWRVLCRGLKLPEREPGEKRQNTVDKQLPASAFSPWLAVWLCASPLPGILSKKRHPEPCSWETGPERLKCVCMSSWGVEVGSRNQCQVFSHYPYYFWVRISQNLEFTNSARLDDQGTPGVCWSLPPQHWDYSCELSHPVFCILLVYVCPVDI